MVTKGTKYFSLRNKTEKLKKKKKLEQGGGKIHVTS